MTTSESPTALIMTVNPVSAEDILLSSIHEQYIVSDVEALISSVPTKSQPEVPISTEQLSIVYNEESPTSQQSSPPIITPTPTATPTPTTTTAPLVPTPTPAPAPAPAPASTLASQPPPASTPTPTTTPTLGARINASGLLSNLIKEAVHASGVGLLIPLQINQDDFTLTSVLSIENLQYCLLFLTNVLIGITVLYRMIALFRTFTFETIYTTSLFTCAFFCIFCGLLCNVR